MIVAGLDSAWLALLASFFLSLFRIFHVGFDKSWRWRFQFPRYVPRQHPAIPESALELMSELITFL